MPVFHVGGCNWGLHALANGARAVIEREFDPRKVLETVERHGITKLFLVPSAIQIVVREFQSRPIDFSGVRYLLYGASPIPLALMLETMQTLRCQLVQLYGMTETSGTIVALPPHEHREGSQRLRSAGRPLPGVEMAILDPEGRQVPARVSGEIVIRSPSNMLGYWNREEETRATLDADNWLRTGDAGFLDEEGYVYIQDRVKDMIISGGENIFPAEVENAIHGHPDVAEVAVIGVPDDHWGEAVMACVVARPGSVHDPDSILAWARARIAGFKVPKTVQFVDVLPRNPAGKLLKRELRRPFWEGRGRSVN
jgi:fatty-acyl-CoA synthase